MTCVTFNYGLGIGAIAFEFLKVVLPKHASALASEARRGKVSASSAVVTPLDQSSSIGGEDQSAGKILTVLTSPANTISSYDHICMQCCMIARVCFKVVQTSVDIIDRRQSSFGSIRRVSMGKIE